MIRKGMVQKLPPKCRGSGGGGHIKNIAIDECHLGEVELSHEDIDRLDYSCILQTWDLLNVALSTGVPFLVVPFEGMQQSKSDTMRDLGLFTGWNELTTYHWKTVGMDDDRDAQDRSSQTIKVTPEDLNKVIANYEEVESTLKSRDMKCYQEMLQERTATIFPLCRVPNLLDVVL